MTCATPSFARVRRAFCLAGLVLAAMAAGTAAQGPNATIVALGASNTAGWGVAPSESYPAQLGRLLEAKGVRTTIVNAGVPGDTTGGMLARLDTTVPAATRLVILQPGTNDMAYGSMADRAANIAEIGRRLAARGIRLLIIENTMLEELPKSELREDRIHYTPKGYAILAERLLPQVLDALGK